MNLKSVAAVVHTFSNLLYSFQGGGKRLHSNPRQRSGPFGISVCAVIPGDMKTGFTRPGEAHLGDDIYGGRIGRSVATMERTKWGRPPEEAARFICKVALKPKVKPVYTIGLKYRVFVWLSRILPWGLSNRIIGSLYAR